MDPARVFGKGIAFPFRLGADKRIAWSEGEDNIREAIQIILRTELEERLRLDSFGAGLASLLFLPNTVATRHQVTERIRDALRRWEPRIAIEAVEAAVDPDDAEAAIVTIHYKLIATQTRDKVGVSLKLGG